MADGNQVKSNSPSFKSPGGKERDLFRGLPWIEIQDLASKGYEGALDNLMLIIGSMTRYIEFGNVV